jgi:hypothetical protein
MKNKLLRLPFTSIAVVFAVTVVSAALIGDINLIEMPVSMLNRNSIYAGALCANDQGSDMHYFSGVQSSIESRQFRADCILRC